MGICRSAHLSGGGGRIRCREGIGGEIEIENGGSGFAGSGAVPVGRADGALDSRRRGFETLVAGKMFLFVFEI